MMQPNSCTTSAQLPPTEFLDSFDVLHSSSSSHMNSLQLDTPEFEHFHNRHLGFSIEFEMNILIALLQPQTGFSNSKQLPTNDVVMDACTTTLTLMQSEEEEFVEYDLKRGGR